jgi:L-amino acid N-acyltransferase YncA
VLSSADPAIHPASPADLPGVQRIYAHYVASSVATFEENPPAVADWRRRLETLAGLGLPFLVARQAGRVLGYAYASPWNPRPAYRHTVEDSIYADPAYTGRGTGGALLGALLTACAQVGVRQVIAVIADTGDEASAALHRSLGFTDAGRLTAVGRKHGRWVDTLLMQRDLTTGSAVQERAGSGQ